MSRNHTQQPVIRSPRQPRTRATLLAALLLLASLLTSCMGGDDDGEEARDEPTAVGTAALNPATPPASELTATVPQETPTPEPPTPSPTPVDTRVLTLQEGFFSLDDLPQGYYQRRDAESDTSSVKSDDTEGDDDDNAGICNVPLAGPQPEVSVARVWERTFNGPFIRQELLWLPDGDESVDAWLRERRLAARACDTWTEPDGSTSEVTILRRPQLASGSPADSLAVRVITTASDQQPIDLVTVILVAEHIATITTVIDLSADVDQDMALSLAVTAYLRAAAIAESAADNP